MERPEKIDFQSNGKVVFTVDGIKKFVQNLSDTFKRLDNYSIQVGDLQFDIYALLEITVNGVTVATYTAIDPLNPQDAEARLIVVFDAFTEYMTTSPIDVTVDAPITIEAPISTLEGYAILSVDDSAVVDLSDGVDSGGTPVPIPVDATGARLVVQFTTVDSKMLFAANGLVPDNSPEVGEYIVENRTVILLGRTPDSNGPVTELADFKAIMITAKTATILITYFKMA